jgi:glycerophosphoryl diester phosphodiesterase
MGLFGSTSITGEIMKQRLFLGSMLMAAFFALAACGGGDDKPAAPKFNTLSGAAPIVIGHRGASGELPEHTLEAYKRAIDQGANCIEPDLALTKDGVMIARHEPMLDDTTDVADKFPASRKSTRNLDGVTTTAYFASDFTLAEVKTLRAKQSRASRPQQFNGQYAIPTLDEVITLAKTQSTALTRTICIYPEIKHSTFHASVVNFGTNTFEDKLVATLHAAYGNTTTAPVFIQSFEVSNLQYLNTRTAIKLVQLIDADDVNADGSMSLVAPYLRPYDFEVKRDTRTFADLLTPAGMDFVKTYADGIGPWKPYLVKTVNDNVERTGDTTITINDRRVDGSTGVIERAHSKGLLVHTWTFRNDASGYGFKDPKAEMQYYFKLGVDGLFTDYTATGVDALKGL